MEPRPATASSVQGAGALLRRRPHQARSEARITHILDTVAAVVADQGAEQVTTSVVAGRSAMSVGALYRYFPDRQGLLSALARRNRDRFLERLAGDLERRPVAGWDGFVDRYVDACSRMHTAEPGFTRLRFGVGAGEAAGTGAGEAAGTGGEPDGPLPERLAPLLAGALGVPDGPELVFHLRVVTDIIDVLLARAYASRPGGDGRLVEVCRAVASDYLSRRLPPPAPAAARRSSRRASLSWSSRGPSSPTTELST